MRTRRFLVGVMLAVGIAVSGITLSPFLSLNVSSVVFLPLGILLLLLAFWVMFRRLVTEIDSTDSVAPELPRQTRIPGSEFDRKLAEQRERRSRDSSYTQQRIRERLESIAQTILVTHGRLSPLEAAEQIQAGEWTQNQAAAVFLQGDSLPLPPLHRRVTTLFRSSSRFADGVQHTVRALVQYTGITPYEEEVNIFQQFQDYLRDPSPTASSASKGPSTETRGEDNDITTTTCRLTNHWRGISVLALGGLAFGLLFEEPNFILASTIGIGYTAYSRLRGTPSIGISVSHSLSEATPSPGKKITVTVIVENESEYVLSDLRIIDGVPIDLGVEDNSPYHATVLPPGTTTSYEYTVRVRRGIHPFLPVRVRSRTMADTVEVETTIESETTIVCRPTLASTCPVSLRNTMTQYVGQIATMSGGYGTEFHSTREYRRGDDINRIDWNRLARSGEFSTVAYQEERTVEIVIVVDTRAAAYVSAEPYGVHACDRSSTAAGELFATFWETGNRVGLVAFGPEACWMQPTASRESHAHIRKLLTEHPAFSQHPPNGTCYVTDWLNEFQQRLTKSVQVILISPLCDSAPVRLARRLEADGYLATVISPDPTTTETVGQQIAHLERQARLYELRQATIRVVDWPIDEKLWLALDRATLRWTQ